MVRELLAEFDDLVDSGGNAVLVLTTGLGVVGLTATATLDELGGLADNLSGVQTMVLNHILRQHHAEHRLVVGDGSDDADEILGDSLPNL